MVPSNSGRAENAINAPRLVAKSKRSNRSRVTPMLKCTTSTSPVASLSGHALQLVGCRSSSRPSLSARSCAWSISTPMGVSLSVASSANGGPGCDG